MCPLLREDACGNEPSTHRKNPILCNETLSVVTNPANHVPSSHCSRQRLLLTCHISQFRQFNQYSTSWTLAKSGAELGWLLPTTHPALSARRRSSPATHPWELDLGIDLSGKHSRLTFQLQTALALSNFLQTNLAMTSSKRPARFRARRGNSRTTPLVHWCDVGSRSGNFQNLQQRLRMGVPRRGPTLRPPTSEPPRWLLLRRPLAHGSVVEEETTSRDPVDWRWTARDATCSCQTKTGLLLSIVSLSNFYQHNANPKLNSQRLTHCCTTTTRKMLRVSGSMTHHLPLLMASSVQLDRAPMTHQDGTSNCCHPRLGMGYFWFARTPYCIWPHFCPPTFHRV